MDASIPDKCVTAEEGHRSWHHRFCCAARIAHGHDRRRTRQSIEDRQLTYNPTSADEGEDSLGTGAGDHHYLEQTILDAYLGVMIT